MNDEKNVEKLGFIVLDGWTTTHTLQHVKLLLLQGFLLFLHQGLLFRSSLRLFAPNQQPPTAQRVLPDRSVHLTTRPPLSLSTCPYPLTCETATTPSSTLRRFFLVRSLFRQPSDSPSRSANTIDESLASSLGDSLSNSTTKTIYLSIQP